jgi:hypothetical protein
MKKILPFVAIVILVLCSYHTTLAQLRKIPAAVTDAFQQKYPNASHVEWKDKMTSFVAVFRIDDVQYEARFNKHGVWKETEHAVTTEDIPAAVQQGYDKSKYAEEWKIEAVYKILLPDDKEQYRLLVRKSDLQKKNLLFNSNGRLIKDSIAL